MFQTNTFQLVMATNQIETIVLYIYGDMQWSGREFDYSSSSQVGIEYDSQKSLTLTKNTTITQNNQGCIVEFESGPAKIRQLSVGDTRASGPGVPTACAGWVREGLKNP